MFQIVKEKIEANYNSIERISKNPFVAMDSILAYLASTFVSNLYLIFNINLVKWPKAEGRQNIPCPNKDLRSLHGNLD